MLLRQMTQNPVHTASDLPKTMSLSVILPNYNHGDLIARALLALLNQTPAAHEIIVVDDGSTDNSVEVIEALQRLHPSIRLIRNPVNRGIVASVKTALDVATGEYLLFAGSDDFVLPGLFGRAFAALQAYPQAAFFCASVALLDIQDRVIGLRPVTVPRHGRGYLSPADGYGYGGPNIVLGGGSLAVFRSNLYLLAGPEGSAEKLAVALDQQMPAAARDALADEGRAARWAVLPQDTRIAALDGLLALRPGDAAVSLRRDRLEAAQNLSEARALLIARELQMLGTRGQP